MLQSSMETSDLPSASMTLPSSTADGDMDTDDKLESLYIEMVSTKDNTERKSTADDDAISSDVRDMLISKKTLLNKLSVWVQKKQELNFLYAFSLVLGSLL